MKKPSSFPDQLIHHFHTPNVISSLQVQNHNGLSPQSAGQQRLTTTFYYSEAFTKSKPAIRPSTPRSTPRASKQKWVVWKDASKQFALCFIGWLSFRKKYWSFYLNSHFKHHWLINTFSYERGIKRRWWKNWTRQTSQSLDYHKHSYQP